MGVKRIEIEREISFGELCGRLRNVRLRGFPDIRIYKDAKIGIRSLTPEEVREEIFIPQPSVYKPELDKVARIAEIFRGQRIDIFRLDRGFDYIAFNEDGKVSEWTLIPPVIEAVFINYRPGKGLDYSEFIGPELRRMMYDRGYKQNPELKELSYPAYQKFAGKICKIHEICDGSHRIEIRCREGLSQNLLFVDSPKPGFPYYAAPKPYATIHEEPERIEEKIDKTHVLTAPGHKVLYRLFPSGGINSGTVRPLKQKFD